LKHGITDEEWEDFLAGQGAVHSHARIDAHLMKCVQCWELYQQESPAMRAVAAAAIEAREKLVVSDERVQSVLAAVLSRIGMEDDSTTTAQIRSGLDFLRSILDPVFGPKAAQCALLLAASGSDSLSLDGLTRESWTAFLERLAAMISIICGDVFAGLIREHGQLVPVGL